MTRHLLKATSVVGVWTLASRVLGLVRDVAFAAFLGAGAKPLMDAFLVALKIPNFLRRLFAEGSFQQAFVPVLAEYKAKHGEAATRELIDRVTGTLAGVLLVITVVGCLAAPLLVYAFAPGFQQDGTRFELAASMLRITFPYLFFISLTALAGAILNTFGRFAVPAFTPVLLNVVQIITVVWIAPTADDPALVLAGGVFVAGLVQMLFQVPFLMRIAKLPRPRWDWQHPGVQRVLQLMIPSLFGSSITQISLLLDTILASLMVMGSVSWLYYADRLMEFPLGVFGIALATVVLPALSQRHAEASPEGFRATLDWALRLTFVIAVPASVGLFLLAGPMLSTLFQYGEFTVRDVQMASSALMAYAVGMFGFTLAKILAPAFFARQDTTTPVRVGLIALGATMAFNVFVVLPWTLMDGEAPHTGLAIATSLGAFVNAGLLYRGLRRAGVYQPLPGWGPLLLQVGLANLAMGAVLSYGSPELSVWLGWGAATRISQLGLWVGAGALTYLVVLVAAGLRPRHLRTAAVRAPEGGPV
jgi:putative peptidoglycan lipid II flippase